MSWKPKEKDLTPEEAVELARKELAPYWLGSSPLIAGVKNGDRFIVVPLDPDFLKKSWLILFADPTDFGGETSHLYLKEWHRRYDAHGLNTLCVYVPPYSYLKNRETIQRMKDNRDLDFPLVVDTEGTMAAAFGAKDLPKVLLFDKGKVHLSNQGKDYLKDTELKIQRFLRASEPGLPLLLVFEPSNSMRVAQDTFRIEFGSQTPKRGCSADFSTQGRLEKMKPETVSILGNWQRESEKITTQDPNATLKFISPFSRVSLIAQSSSKILEAGAISVEVNDEPVYEDLAGAHMALDDNGRSLVKVTFPQIYHALAGLKSGSAAEVTLRFPQANAVPVSLYGLRFGD